MMPNPGKMYTKLQGSLMADVRFGSRPDSSLSDGRHDAHRVRPHCGWQSAGGVVHHEFGDALLLAIQADAGPGTAQQRCLIQRKRVRIQLPSEVKIPLPLTQVPGAFG